MHQIVPSDNEFSWKNFKNFRRYKDFWMKLEIVKAEIFWGNFRESKNPIIAEGEVKFLRNRIKLLMRYVIHIWNDKTFNILFYGGYKNGIKN